MRTHSARQTFVNSNSNVMPAAFLELPSPYSNSIFLLHETCRSISQLLFVYIP